MASGRLIDYLGTGVIASRPATPVLHTGTLGLWFATDTGILSAWDGSTWEDIGGGGGGGGTTDHGALTGLGDDDHSQYHNDTRGDARYLKLSDTLEVIDDQVAALLSAGTGISLAYNDGIGDLEISATGGNIGKHAIWVDAQAMRPHSQSPATAVIHTAGASGQPDQWYSEFDETTAQYLGFRVTMPKSWDAGTVSCVFVWQHAATTTNFGVVFNLQAVAHQDNTSLATNFGTAVQVADTGGTTGNVYVSAESSAITVSGSPAKSNPVNFRVGRVPTDGSDTLAAKAMLLGLVLFITTDAGNDA